MNNRQPIIVSKITALYERLSKDDDQRNESVSIANQKRILEEYAAKNGFRNTRHFVDDGITGTVFSRPGLNAMIDEVKAGNVATVIIKDQSRIGRDVVEVGLLKRTFEENGVRFIAAEDGLDTAKGFDIMSIIRDVLNEFYVADTSRKIRAVLNAKGNEGKHLTCTALYGYIKNPDDKEKNEWLIDPEAAAVVRRIFQMTIDGIGPYKISKMLTDEKIMRPSVYIALRDGGNYTPKGASEPYTWSGRTVQDMLKHLEYTGCTVNFRTYKGSYKDKRHVFRPEDEWLIFENTQEPIVSRETWATAQKCRTVKRRPDSLGKPNPLTGLVLCGDCGKRMFNRRYAEGINKHPNYSCQNYTTYPRKCTRHHIRVSVLEKITLDSIQAVSGYVRENEDDFIRQVQEAYNLQSAEAAKAQEKQLARSQKRHAELDSLISHLYEDKVRGELSAKRFEILSGGYECEQEDLERQIADLEAELESFNSGNGNADRFIEIVRRYSEIPELTATILNEYIDKILVYERERVGTRWEQRVEIFFKFVGKVAFPKPVEETEPIDPEVQRRREYHRAYYLRHRENILAKQAARRATAKSA